MKKKISLSYYDGSEGSEYDIYNDGEVTVYVNNVINSKGGISNELYLFSKGI